MEEIIDYINNTEHEVIIHVELEGERANGE